MSHTSFIEERAAGIVTCQLCGQKFPQESGPCGCGFRDEGVTDLGRFRATRAQRDAIAEMRKRSTALPWWIS